MFEGPKIQKVETPDVIWKYLEKTYGKVIDLAPINYVEGKSKDSFKLNWKYSSWVYINPPYKNVTPWVLKAFEDSQKYGTNFVFLIPAATQTILWQNYIFKNAARIQFIRQYVKFKGYDGALPCALALVEIQRKIFSKEAPKIETISFEKKEDVFLSNLSNTIKMLGSPPDIIQPGREKIPLFGNS